MLAPARALGTACGIGMNRITSRASLCRLPLPNLASAQAQFPPSANRNVQVANAWRPAGDATRPEPYGPDGWASIGEPATRAVVSGLRDRGYTWVNLSTGGTANPFREVAIAELI
jgi:hypothetical protein